MPKTFERQRPVSKTITILIMCFILPLGLGALSAYFSGIFKPNLALSYAPFQLKLTPLAWLAAYFFLGVNLFLVLTASSHTYLRSTIKTKTVSLWISVFVLTLILPFFIYLRSAYLFSFISLAVACSLMTALFIMSLRLRIFSGIALIPYAVWIGVLTYMVFYAVLG